MREKITFFINSRDKENRKKSSLGFSFSMFSLKILNTKQEARLHKQQNFVTCRRLREHGKAVFPPLAG